jgi:signal transduction histidine kinase
MKMKRGLRWHLFEVLLLGILPVGLFAAALLFLNWRAQEQERRTIQIETARVLAAAVDNALDSTIQRASILARLWAAQPGDHRRVYEHALTALPGNPDWSSILAFKASGEMVFRTELPFGAPSGGARLRGYSAEALRVNRPVVSEIFTSSERQRSTVGVAVPVSRDGAATHVLIVGLKLDWFDELLSRQGLPPGAIVGIFDGALRFVARSHDGRERRGAGPAPGLDKDMRASAEGLGRYPSLDGDSVYTSWARTRHGWTVAFATPAAPIDGALARHLWMLGGLLAAVIAAGFVFAALKGRRITAAHEALARERDALLTTEQNARAAAEAANRAKDEFLAMLSHELRNPLSAIANSITVLRTPGCEREHAEFAAAVIHRQSWHLKRLIDDLLDVARVMTGKIRLQRRPLDLEAAIREVIATLETAGTLARHRVEVDAKPAWIDGDRVRIEQIVTNLLSNAVGHTPPSKVIRVTLWSEGAEGVLRVADEGTGIAPEHMERIFDLFFQAHGTRAGRQGGLGIGLTLVKRLVELHGGSIAVASAGPGLGASFTVRLPAAAARAASPPSHAAAV